MKGLYTWTAIVMIIVASTAGDILISYAMKQIGDLGEVRRRHGLIHVIGRVVGNGAFLCSLCFMACAFFSLLFALSWGDVSLVVPASASLTFVSNAIAARIFLKENVDRRRWAAALLVAGGVALLAA
jgi:drug/metabolite transporter (DMT)-like permease